MENIKTLKELLEYAAATYKDKTFISSYKKNELVEKSFNQLKKDSFAIGRFLRNAFGAEKKRIAVLGSASYEYVISYLGAVCSGNVVVQVDCNVAPDKLSKILEHGKVDAVFYEKKISQRVLYVKRKNNGIPLFVCMDDEDENNLNTLKSHIKYNVGNLENYCDEDACSVIAEEMTFDGEIIEKKLSNKNIIDNVQRQGMRISQEDIVLSLMPIHIVECFNTNVILSMKQGATLCFKTSMVSMIEDIKRYKPTKIEVNSALAQTLLNFIKKDESIRNEVSDIYTVNEFINLNVIKEYQEYGIRTEKMSKFEYLEE